MRKLLLCCILFAGCKNANKQPANEKPPKECNYVLPNGYKLLTDGKRWIVQHRYLLYGIAPYTEYLSTYPSESGNGFRVSEENRIIYYMDSCEAKAALEPFLLKQNPLKDFK